MIFINNFTISEDLTSLEVSVETDVDETITSALVWTDRTFKDYNQAVDVSSYLTQASNEEVFSIPAEDLGESVLHGIYFIEFETTAEEEDGCTTCNNTIGVAASLSCFKECLLEKVKEYKVCNDFSNQKCTEHLLDSIINIHVLIESLCIALMFGYYTDAIDILASLNKLCDCPGCSNCGNCQDCKDLPTPNFQTGLDYGTFDNDFILI